MINQTYSFQTIANGIERTNASEVWILIFYVAIFMLSKSAAIMFEFRQQTTMPSAGLFQQI